MTDAQAGDRRWLDAAARLATPYLGTTAENPTVGALVVKDGLLLGRGVTAQGGRPHAEPQALAMAGQGARGATLYVTLEPCNHWGRTPPCVDAVIAAGVARVVVGLIDRDPRTAGQSIAKLRAAGIETTVLDHAPSRRLHEGFINRVTLSRPFVTLKLAVSADGGVGSVMSGPVAISHEPARRWAHMLRALSDAIMVGVSTANYDDPRLTVRLGGLESRTPMRLVLAGSEPPFHDLTLFTDANPTVVIGLTRPVHLPPQIAFWPVSLPDWPTHQGPRPANFTGHRPDLAEALSIIAGKGVSTLLVEGGQNLTEALVTAGLVDRFHLITSDIVIGPERFPAPFNGALTDRLAAAGLVEVDRRPLGPDMLATFEREA